MPVAPKTAFKSATDKVSVTGVPSSSKMSVAVPSALKVKLSLGYTKFGFWQFVKRKVFPTISCRPAGVLASKAIRLLVSIYTAAKRSTESFGQ